MDPLKIELAYKFRKQQTQFFLTLFCIKAIEEKKYWQEKINVSVEFKIHLIHRKLISLLHKTVLILCYEWVELVGVIKELHALGGFFVPPYEAKI